uniref:GOLD domain-containing protein n=1 Tax=Plectus sambesii TaxID=2011161 RepID=A0A914X948_9BILA
MVMQYISAKPVLHILWILCLTLGLTVGDEFDFTVIVGPGKVECFYQTIDDPKYAAFEFDYQVVDGGDLDISLYLRSPKGIQLVNDYKKNEGDQRIVLNEPNAGRGDYAFCFDNTFSMQSSKTVFFEFFLLDEKGEYLNGFDQAFKQEEQAENQMEDFRQTTVRVKSSLNRIEHLQSQLRAVEFRDRSIMEANYERVNFWSIVHLCVMLFTLLVQVFMVRSLFEERSTVGRLIRKGKLAD